MERKIIRQVTGYRTQDGAESTWSGCWPTEPQRIMILY